VGRRRPDPLHFPEVGSQANQDDKVRYYSRLYHDILEDPRFEGVYGHPPVFGVYAMLLMQADRTWPAPAPLPRWADQSSVDTLQGCGLIEVMSGDLYRINGLNDERRLRSEHSRIAAGARWNPGMGIQSRMDAPSMPGACGEDAETMPR
jgi:hypothetical protein